MSRGNEKKRKQDEKWGSGEIVWNLSNSFKSTSSTISICRPVISSTFLMNSVFTWFFVILTRVVFGNDLAHPLWRSVDTSMTYLDRHLYGRLQFLCCTIYICWLWKEVVLGRLFGHLWSFMLLVSGWNLVFFQTWSACILVDVCIGL